MFRYILSFLFVLQFILTESKSQDTVSLTNPKKKYDALLWEITGNGLTRPSYIYGALETSQKLAYHLIDSFFTAFYAAETIVLDMHPDSTAKAMRNPDILKRLYKNTINTAYQPSYNYYKILIPSVYDADMFEYILSGFSNGSMAFGMGDADMEEQKTLPDFVYMAALKTQKKVMGLVSYNEFLDLTDSAKKWMKEEEKQNRNIREDYASQYLLYQKAFEVYRKGDLGLLDSIYRQMVNMPGLFTNVLEPWYCVLVDRLEALLHSTSLFAVMDATAMAGEQGIIEGLRQKGYHLKPVTHYILNRPNHQKDKLEKLTRRVRLVGYTSPSGCWSVRVPEYTIGSTDEMGGNAYFIDILNDARYSVQRYPTNAQLTSYSTDYLFEQMDSVLYEFVPGKIIRRKEITDGGYPGIIITNRTSRGDLERFKLVITPLEIIIFRITGKKGFIRKNGAGKKFIASAKLHLSGDAEWKTVTTAHGEFSLSLPPYHIADTVSNIAFVDPEITWEAWDAASGSYFLFKRNIHHDLDFLEEDTFDLSYMAGQIAKAMKMESGGDSIGQVQGYPALTLNMWTKGNLDTLRCRLVLRGACHYLLLTNASDQGMVDRFFEGFRLVPFHYNLQDERIVDTMLAYSVVSDVNKQESPDDDEDDHSWMYDEEEEEHNDYAEQEHKATYFFGSGSEYVVVERFKHHDYQQYLSYQELWDSLSMKATLRGDLQIAAVRSDSACLFPYLDLMLSDTGTVRQIHKRYLTHQGLVFILSAMHDTIAGEQPYTTRFFETFTPIADSLIGRSPFEDKGWLFIRNFLATDTLLVRQAIQSLGLIRFREHHRDSLLYLISNIGLMKRNTMVARTLIEAYGNLKTDAYRNDLEKIYTLYDGYPAIRTSIFRAIALQRHLEARKTMLRIMAADIPLPGSFEDIHSLARPLLKSPGIALALFPEILKYDRYPEYSRLIYTLLAELIEKQMFDIDKYPDIRSVLKTKVQDELKRRRAANLVDKASSLDLQDYYTSFYLDTDFFDDEFVEAVVEEVSGSDEGEMYQSFEDEGDTGTNIRYSELVLLLKALSYSKPGEDWLPGWSETVLTGRNKNDALALAVHLAKNGKPVHDSIWTGFARNPRIRPDLYRKLKESGLAGYFDTVYLKQELFAESFLQLKENLKPDDSLSYLQRRYIQTPRKSGYVYFFKHLSGYGKDKDWVISVVGIQPEDTTRVSPVADFVKTAVDMIYADDDTQEIIDKQMKELRKLYRKRFTGDEYEYDESMIEEYDF